MKNLENFGVQEMNTEEIKTIDGGGLLSDIWDFKLQAKVLAYAAVLAVSAYNGAVDGANAVVEAHNNIYH
tara:strand:- start:635 stop:844 length:210 start_codon:yes stop_codon:yes gene_type:complete